MKETVFIPSWATCGENRLRSILALRGDGVPPRFVFFQALLEGCFGFLCFRPWGVLTKIVFFNVLLVFLWCFSKPFWNVVSDFCVLGPGEFLQKLCFSMFSLFSFALCFGNNPPNPETQTPKPPPKP